MKKGIVIGCPRLKAVLPQAASIMKVDVVDHYRTAGPEAVMLLPELADRKKGLLVSMRGLAQGEDIQAYGIVAHTDCAGHKVDAAAHYRDVQKAAQVFKAELRLKVPVYALLVSRATSGEWSWQDVGKY